MEGNQQITEKIKICIEMNENENTTQNLWDAKGKIHSITGLPQETRKKSNK